MWESSSAGNSQSIYFIRWTESFAADWNFQVFEGFKDLEKNVTTEFDNDLSAVRKTNSDKIIFPANSGSKIAKKALEDFKIETSGGG